MKDRIIRGSDFVTTSWAGGETTQLAIYPEDGNFSERDFLWRISSATFTSTSSKFSDFTGFQRYLLPLEGKLSVSHKGLYGRDMEAYEVEYFDGAWETTSENSLDCRDYNFIVRSGSRAKLQILKEGSEYQIKDSGIITLFSTDPFVAELESANITRDVEGFALYIVEVEEKDKIRISCAKKPVVLTEFYI